MLTGVISGAGSGWQNVFYMLISCDLMAALLLSRVVYKEIKLLRQGPVDDVTIIVPKVQNGAEEC